MSFPGDRLVLRGVVPDPRRDDSGTPSLFELEVDEVTAGPQTLVGETVVIEMINGRTEILWVGNSDLAPGTRVEAEVELGESQTYLADTVRVDNSTWHPYRP
jgi:hypothetical protein